MNGTGERHSDFRSLFSKKKIWLSLTLLSSGVGCLSIGTGELEQVCNG